MKQSNHLQTSLLAIVTLATSLAFSSCHRLFSEKGEGPIIEQTLDINTFTGVNLGSAFDIEIIFGETPSVIAVGHQNVVSSLNASVSNSIWNAEFKHGRYRDYELKVYITSPEINHIHISGSGDIVTEGFDNLTSLTTKISGSGNITSQSPFQVKNTYYSKISGSGNIDMEVEAKSHNSKIDGSGELYLTGEVESQDIDISGSGDIHAYDLPCKYMNIDISGSGDIQTTVLESLDVDISGSGNIYYKGNPVVTRNISGSGDIHKKG